MRHSRQDAPGILPAPTTPPANVSFPEPETPHAHYMDHIHENGPPSPLQAADSPWTKRLKSWYWKQVVSRPVIDLSDDEVVALDEKPLTPSLAHVDSPSSNLFEHDEPLSPLTKDLVRGRQQLLEESDSDTAEPKKLPSPVTLSISNEPLHSLRLMGPEFDPPRSVQSDPIEDDSPVAMSSRPDDSFVAMSSRSDDRPVAMSSRPVPERACPFPNLQAVRSRQFKYGTCPVHHRAMRVTVGYSGIYAGRPCVRCPLFWEKTEDGKPSCWQQGPCRYPMEELPKAIRAKVQELKQDLRWSLRHGPSTR